LITIEGIPRFKVLVNGVEIPLALRVNKPILDVVVDEHYFGLRSDLIDDPALVHSFPWVQALSCCMSHNLICGGICLGPSLPI